MRKKTSNIVERTEEQKRDYRLAMKAYGRANEQRWVFALHSSRIVGKYGRGGTLGLADDMGISSDTVEDHAHAFWMFDRLRKLGESEYIFVSKARKLPYIYYSHFRALYDIQIRRNLTDEQIMNLLVDIVQAEGGISSRNIEDHAHSKYGDTRTWTYYAAKALKELNKTEGQPDLPNVPETIGISHMVTFSVYMNPVTYLVVAYNKPRAEAVARKQLALDLGKGVEKSARCVENKEIGKTLSDSKHILNVASSWLGDNS